MDVCAEINAAAPQDQQRFPVSCEVTGLRSELRYHLRPKLRFPPPVPSGCGREAEAGKALGSAMIHGETFVRSANITAKQVKYSSDIVVLADVCLFAVLWMLAHIQVARAHGRARATGR